MSSLQKGPPCTAQPPDFLITTTALSQSSLEVQVSNASAEATLPTSRRVSLKKAARNRVQRAFILHPFQQLGAKTLICSI